MKKTNNPFKIESMRSALAKKRDYKKLVTTYSNAYAEIKDQNTPKLWDYLNIEGRSLIPKNPMETDRLKTVSKWIKGNNLRVLNIGFGSASLEEKVFSKNPSLFKDWIGIDISPASVKQAKEKIPQGKFELGNIDKLKYKKETFDYVISLEVLEHIKPRKIFKSLREIYRVMKPGGILIVSVPLNEGLEEMIKHGSNPNAHVRTYSPELIKAELEIVGFTIEQDKTLFAFNDLYSIKTMLAKTLFKKKFQCNNIILRAKKNN